MKSVYTAANSIEAHAIKIMLHGEGIDSFISGEYATGIVGIIQPKIFVADQDVYVANNIIKNWQQNPNEDEPWFPEGLGE